MNDNRKIFHIVLVLVFLTLLSILIIIKSLYKLTIFLKIELSRNNLFPFEIVTHTSNSRTFL
jgi:hypothetical protein